MLDTFGYPTEDRSGSWEFFRSEVRASSRQRILDCGHRIDRTELYEYSVGKISGERFLVQRLDCDVCMRSGHKY